ncbi:uncharacterized protein FOMMEDRAFT_149880 [Fomitiporia mediterranea MF3/22]|uniref:uncharacterized protein n=1 Tax=Fomitiporia mediterranea (strain MF3/22) TaxID=694068 RepID=UPI0004409AB8|nr:uncharacterized protein FOMMEDRAFT_149880 [Fomitiporia mediterranea MF3/22]EJD07360.1 hypothetical protein FOMMEDRAFT_149880 [Fomitiporia mediterranea MF3/22]
MNRRTNRTALGSTLMYKRRTQAPHREWLENTQKHRNRDETRQSIDYINDHLKAIEIAAKFFDLASTHPVLKDEKTQLYKVKVALDELKKDEKERARQRLKKLNDNDTPECVMKRQHTRHAVFPARRQFKKIKSAFLEELDGHVEEWNALIREYKDKGSMPLTLPGMEEVGNNPLKSFHTTIKTILDHDNSGQYQQIMDICHRVYHALDELKKITPFKNVHHFPMKVLDDKRESQNRGPQNTEHGGSHNTENRGSGNTIHSISTSEYEEDSDDEGLGLAVEFDRLRVSRNDYGIFDKARNDLKQSYLNIKKVEVNATAPKRPILQRIPKNMNDFRNFKFGNLFQG